MFIFLFILVVVIFRFFLFFFLFHSLSVEIYVRMSTDLLPTPAKSHYVFNLRDLSKCIQGKKTESFVYFEKKNTSLFEKLYNDLSLKNLLE